MSHAKQVSKRKRRTKAVTALGVAGLLSLAGGASAKSLIRQRICRRRTLQRIAKSLLKKKKSRTSVWRLSMYSTKKTSEHIVPAYSLPNTEAADTGAVAVAEAAEAAEAAGVAAAAAAVEVAAEVGVFRWEVSASAVPDLCWRIAANIARLPHLLEHAPH
jgi:hypothetical protein